MTSGIHSQSVLGGLPLSAVSPVFSRNSPDRKGFRALWLVYVLLIPALLGSLTGAEPLATVTLPLRASWETGQAPDGSIRWTGALSNRHDIRIAVDLQGVKLEDYDEALISYRTNDSDTQLSARIDNWPESGEVSIWYLKDRDTSSSWSEWRFQLAHDDEGEFAQPKVDDLSTRTMFLQIFGNHPPTPEGRDFSIEIGSLTLVRNPVRLHLHKDRTSYEKQDAKWITKTPVVVSNPSDRTLHASLILDVSACKLHQAGIDRLGEHRRDFPLPGHAQAAFVVTTAMDASTRPGTLVAEPVGVHCEVKESPGIRVRNLTGARVESLWPTRPPREETRFPASEQTQALIAEKKAVDPRYATLASGLISRADSILGKPVEIPMEVARVHPQRYICPDCNGPLTPIDATHHRCEKEGKTLSDPTVNNAYVTVSHGRNFADAYDCALAYQMTGDEKYARKAIAILTLYGEKYRTIPSLPGRSTATGSKLAAVTLLEAFTVPRAFEAYRYVASSGSLSENQRKTIVEGFLLPCARTLQRHSSRLNQQAEHFRWIVLAGLWGKDWNMVGEALNSRNGYYDYLATGFTKDGVGTEGGAYAAAQVSLLSQFVGLARESGLDLVTPRLKSVFDAPVMLSPEGIVKGGQASAFEAFYEENPNPAYLPTLKAARAQPNLPSALSKIAELPPSGTQLENSSRLSDSGYTVLRRQTSAGHLALMINHGMQWERDEYDRSHFKLFVDGRQVSRQVGRITYGSKYSPNMYSSWAHNMMTVDLENAAKAGWIASEILEKENVAAVLLTNYPHAPLYGGIRQQRLAAIVGPVFFIADRAISSEGKRRFDWHYYPETDTVGILGNASLQPASVAISDFPAGDKDHPPMPEGSFGPGRLTSGQSFSAIFQDKTSRGLPPMLGTFVSSSPETEFLSATVQQFYAPRLHPFVRLTQRASSAWFASAFTPQAGPSRQTAPEIRIKLDSVSAVVWEVALGDSRYLVGFNSSENPVTVDGNKLSGPIIVHPL